MREYYAYRMRNRIGKTSTLAFTGRLYQQYGVDAYTSIEESNLNWIRKNLE